MKRKIVSILLSATMLLGAVSLSACTNNELEAKLEELQIKIEQLQDQNEELQANVTQQQAQIEELEEQIEMNSIKSIIVGDKIIKEINVDNMVELSYWFFTSGVPNNRITLYSSIENAVFECVVDKGKFGFGSDAIKQATVSPNETIYWYDHREDIDQAFIEVVLKHEDNYIGYAIIKIFNIDGLTFSAVVLKSAIFPKVDGEYQNITKKELQLIITSQKI